MSGAIYTPTPTATEMRAAARHEAFKQKIAAKASSVGIAKFTSPIGSGAVELHYDPMPPLSVWLTVSSISGGFSQKLTIEEIQKAVARCFWTTPGEIRGASRNKSITLARHVAIYLSRKLFPQYSLPAIGRLFGGRDHVTVIHAARKIQKLLATDPKLKESVEAVMRELSVNFVFPENEVSL